MQLNKQALSKKRWYRQAADAKVLYMTPPWSACYELTVHGRKISVGFKSLVIDLRDDFTTNFLAEDELREVSLVYLERQLKNRRFIFELYRSWLLQFKGYKKLVDKIEQTNLEQLSDVTLRSLYQKFLSTYLRLWQESIFHDAFDFMGDKLLERAIRRDGLQVSPADLAILTTPTNLLSIQRERLALARILLKAPRDSHFKQLMRRQAWPAINKERPAFVKRVEAHQQAYHWMHNNYAHIQQLPQSFFLKNIRQLLFNQKEMENDLNLEKQLASMKRRQRALHNNLHLPTSLRRLLTLLQVVAVWRDERKAFNQMGNSILHQFAKEYARRSGLPLKDVEYAFWWEIPRLLKPSVFLRKVLRERRRGAIYLASNSLTIQSLPGRPGKELRRFMDSLITTRALRGGIAYPGEVTGRAKIILGKRDFSKFKSGDILVAPNTRPEYVPIMKMAGAIITEEGGITSHAAIVSRELRIPAIVGIQGILQAVKNGDKIKVDANEGLVSILP